MSLDNKMLIPELKFTDENLRRHIRTSYYQDEKLLYTTRNCIKGPIGSLYNVNRAGLFALVRVWPVGPIDYKFEGFANSEEFAEELTRIYGSTNGLYCHMFVRLNMDDIYDALSAAGIEGGIEVYDE